MSRLIVFTPNWRGDAVMALPAIADLQRQAPGASLAVAARASIAPLFGLVSGIDEVVVIEKGGAPADEAAGGGGSRARWRGPFLAGASGAPSGLHRVDYYQRLVGALGFRTGPAEPHIALP